MKLGQFAKSDEVNSVKKKLEDTERKVFDSAIKGA